MKTFCKGCFGILWIFIHVPLLFSQETRLFEDIITVPILEKDTVFARNNAFQTLQKRLLAQAVKELLGVHLFEEYQKLIFRQKDIVPGNYLDTVQIQQEYAMDEKFTMKLQGVILLSELKERLRKLNLVLLDDPLVPIVLIVERDLFIPKEKLAERLRLFRIHIAAEDRVDMSAIPYEARDQRPFIESLFNRFPDFRIIYLIEKVSTAHYKDLGEIRVRIFRSTDFTQISLFGLKLKPPIQIANQENHFDRIHSRFLSLFTINSCKRHLYTQGMESLIELELTGIQSPFWRYQFEEKILKPDRNIRSYFLKTLSKDVAGYQLATGYSVTSLVPTIEKSNQHFDLYAEVSGPNRLQVWAIYKGVERISDLDAWEVRPKTIDAIRATFDLPEEEMLNEDLLPEFIEKEPNNTSHELNFLPLSKRVIGNLSSRADEDIFQLQQPEKNHATTLIIDWIRIGKTALSPQLRLYDKNFNFLHSYSVSENQKRMKISHTLQKDATKQLYLRISDSIGFIQGETGGYKSCQYMLLLTWH